MSLLQIIILAMLAFGAIRGWINGLLKELVSAAGFLVGLFIAYKYYQIVGCEFTTALIICVVAPLGLGLLASLITKVLNHVIILGSLNKILGACVGLAKYGLLAYAISQVVEKVEEWKNLLM